MRLVWLLQVALKYYKMNTIIYLCDATIVFICADHDK